MFRIGIDIGGSSVKIGLVDDDNKIFLADKIPFEKVGYENVIAQIAAKICKMTDARHLRSIGIAIPGSVDIEHGVVLAAYNLDFFNAPVRDEMTKHFPGIPVFIANDADAATLAEFKAGALIGANTAVLLTLGTGVGGGLILRGKLFSGGCGRGVELGHMALVRTEDALPCTCGNRGCIEAYCSAVWLETQAQKHFGRLITSYNSNHFGEKSTNYPLSADASKTRLDAKFVIDLAKSGNTTASAILDEYTDNLSAAIASICALLDPEIIAIGGGISEAGDILFDALRKKTRSNNFFKADYKIVSANLGNDAGMLGAAMLE